MGLNMYLRKETYIGANHESRGIEGIIAITKKYHEDTDPEPIDIEFSKVVSITEIAMYWRKANAIHGWFVKNIQNGDDFCTEYIVPRRKLAELLALCKEVQADLTKAQELLPPMGGFFFGSTEVDDWYKSDLNYTVTELSKLLEEPENYEVTYLYQASW